MFNRSVVYKTVWVQSVYVEVLGFVFFFYRANVQQIPGTPWCKNFWNFLCFGSMVFPILYCFDILCCLVDPRFWSSIFLSFGQERDLQLSKLFLLYTGGVRIWQFIAEKRLFRYFDCQVVPSLPRLHGRNRSSPRSESGMGKWTVKPHSTAATVLRGSQATQTNSCPGVLTDESTAGHATDLAHGLPHNTLQGKIVPSSMRSITVLPLRARFVFGRLTLEKVKLFIFFEIPQDN